MNNIWWNKVINTGKLIEYVIEAIQEKKNVLLHLPENVPWYLTLVDLIRDGIEIRNSDISFRKFENIEEEPGKFLLRKFCKSDKQVQYRPAIGYAKFLGESEDIVLNDLIVWISCSSKDKVKQWLEFISLYQKALGKDKKGCIFIIETTDKDCTVNRKNIKYISYSNIIKQYDYYLFNMLAASDIKGSKLFRKYLVEVLSLVIYEDAELSSKCLTYGEAFLNNPTQVLKDIAESKKRSNGLNFEIILDEEIIKEKLWEAQVKVIFPLIERHRNIIVKKYQDEIEKILPIDTSYGEKFEDVSEVELGTISYLRRHSKIMMTNEDAKNVEILKKARNDLAHLKVVSSNDVRAIFQLDL